MEFIIFVATDPTPEPVPDAAAAIDAWVAEGERRGLRKHGDRLRPVADARTVRVRDGELLVTPGPFTESKERIVGFDILDCKDLDEAVDYVARHPMARAGRIEVRPLWG